MKDNFVHSKNNGKRLLFLMSYMLIAYTSSWANDTLDLSHQNLENIPSKYRSKKNTKVLILDGNPLSSLPSWLSEWTSLQTLSLNEVNRLQVLPAFETIGKITSLKNLSWNDGNLLFVPRSIESCSNLEELSIAGNALFELPYYWNENKIKSLNIANNLIDTLGNRILKFKHLTHLNYSKNPGSGSRYNVHTLKQIKELSYLILNGLKKLPENISELISVRSIDLSMGQLQNLPESISKLPHLTTLDLGDNDNLDLSEAIETLNGSSVIHLRLSGAQISRVPFNLKKLKLKSLGIHNACIEYIPGNTSSWSIKALTLSNVRSTVPLENALGRIPDLRKFSLINCPEIASSLSFALFDSLDSLIVPNNNIHSLELRIPLKYADVSGNKIPKEQLKYIQVVKNGGAYDKLKNIKLKSFSGFKTKKEVVASFTGKNVLKKTIYTHIGDQFTFQGIDFKIPMNVFMNKNTDLIQGEVELWIRTSRKPGDICQLGISSNSNSGNQIDQNLTIEIYAFYNDQPAFIDQLKGIQLSHSNHSKVYRMDAYKSVWLLLSPTPTPCALDNNSSAPHSGSSFKSIAYKHRKERPQASFTVRNSKVQMKLKRNKRKGTMTFEITPEYGYKESFFQLFGQRIKGYPELKSYKGLKWKYAGDSLLEDLERLYFLSDKAQEEKLNRKSTFYFYVLDIQDIRIIPHPSKDNYVMSILQGGDTVHIDVLPQLPVMKAKKIQRWHKKRYLKYQRKLVQREIYWNKLDSLKHEKYGSRELKLEQYRNQLLNEYQAKRKQSKESVKNEAGQKQWTTIEQCGLYTIGGPLLLDSGKTVKLKAKVNNRKHYGKLFLIYNKQSKSFYWQRRGTILVENDAEQIVFTMIGKQLYHGTLQENGLLNLSKTK